MNCSNYINCFFKTHTWDVALDQPDLAPTTATNSRAWDQWMDASNNIDHDNDNADVMHATAATVTTTGLSSVNTSPSAPDLSDDTLVTLQLKDKNKNSDFVPCPKLPKGKVNNHNFDKYMESSKPIAPISSGSME